MQLYIAEKPSVARVIAQNLPGKKTAPKGAGYIETDQGVMVTWAIGHIFELAPPGYYTSGVNSFSFEALPILPAAWKTLPKEETKSQVKIIKDLLKRATSVVNAGDPDREGQLIVDEILTDAGTKVPVKRLWLNGMDDVTVQRAISALKENAEFTNMGLSAMARARADWLVGMNLSPAFTLAARKSGFFGTLSVGRVQTPTLAMVVNRDLEIERFVPKDYFVVTVDSKVSQGEFTGKLRVPKGINGVDEEGRIIHEALAKEIVQRVQNTSGVITKYETKKTSDLAPLPYSLSSLQVAASSKHGYSAQMVLDTCQALYERHALATYPRTDCEYLPENYHTDSQATLAHLANNFQIAAQGNASTKGRVFNDKKVTAHHAIIPTTKQANLSLLSAAEKNLYEMISMRYIAQFFPDYVYNKTNVEVTYGKDVFTAAGRVDLSQGWRAVLGKSTQKDKDDESTLPMMTLNESAKAIKVNIDKKKTTPPNYFTEGTLIEAMTNVHLVVTDPEIKRKLKEVAGIGTEATRASIIEGLFKRNFLYNDGKKVKSSETGRALIAVIPNTIKDPGMTALWESSLASIAEGKMTVDGFIDMQSRAVSAIVDKVKSMKIDVPSVKSNSKLAKANESCTKCGKPMRELTAKTGKSAGSKFMGCSGYPACTHTVWPEDKKKSSGSKFSGKARQYDKDKKAA
ncbi:MAG: DNA topoisomerase III [Methylotenera sp.]|uniref:DNA topoisomerase III n=1 Tax=Methylotenera sp. TaxID=2051956 RepID=UPI000D4CD24C|nr:DNA topoisomerase III [Methylotenera sp.]PPC84756.1 MAG: DNA topoisomerase III [Methylotenera sp.]PPD02115.1 MAG: DNA topoisomerase III [Methylotenera sp.]